MMYIVDFAYVKPSLNPKNKSYFIIVCKSFNVLLNLVYKYFVKFLKSTLIMDIACNFLFLVKSLSDFGIRVFWPWKISLKAFPPLQISEDLRSESWSVSCAVMPESLWPHGLWPTRLLCLWNSLGKNSGVVGHFLLHGIFPSQGLNLGLLHCRQILYCLSHQGSHVWEG